VSARTCKRANIKPVNIYRPLTLCTVYAFITVGLLRYLFFFFFIDFFEKPLLVEARANTRKETAKIRNRRMQKKV